ncbi:hypothetical protein [EBPR siphovirus 2]|nr:hypothetical protein [EBPR siphovirus 2]
MVLLALARDALSILGFVYALTITVKIARHYPIRRWFF